MPGTSQSCTSAEELCIECVLTPVPFCGTVVSEDLSLIVANHAYSWGFTCGKSSFLYLHSNIDILTVFGYTIYGSLTDSRFGRMG